MTYLRSVFLRRRDSLGCEIALHRRCKATNLKMASANENCLWRLIYLALKKKNFEFLVLAICFLIVTFEMQLAVLRQKIVSQSSRYHPLGESLNGPVGVLHGAISASKDKVSAFCGQDDQEEKHGFGFCNELHCGRFMGTCLQSKLRIGDQHV